MAGLVNWLRQIVSLSKFNLMTVLSRKGSTAWSLCLSHHNADRLCYVEYDGTEVQVQNQPPAVIAANHRLIDGRDPPPPPSSESPASWRSWSPFCRSPRGSATP